MSAVAAAGGLLLLLGCGALLAAALDRVALARIAGRAAGNPVLQPLRDAAATLLRQKVSTERPDGFNWALAPAAYLALAAVGISVVPLAEGVVAVDLDAGIVLWGACEALTVVVVFLHGWSANALMALLGAYRYVAIGLPAMLLSMFVLIAAALPAESLALSAIVESQRDVWNAVRQPLGLPLFLMLGLTLTLRGPFDYADGYDLACGTSAEVSGPAHAAWQAARLAMLVSVAAIASAVFLGGYLRPEPVPGPVWLALKTAGVLALLVAAGHLFARMPPARMLSLIWTVLLPLSFVGLAIVGVQVLP
jgi:NADH-quinone oxidoreductase subunit H